MESERFSNKKHGFELGWISKYRNELFGLSILSIMLFHFSEDYAGAFARGIVGLIGSSLKSTLVLGYYNIFGSIGVEVFIFLSGMGLYYSFTKNPRIGAFYGRRFKRILIPYLIVAVPFWLIKDLYFGHTGIVTLLQDLTFWSLFSRGVRTIWFIGLMLGLYLVFPLIYKMLDSRRFRMLNFVILIAVTYCGPVLLYFAAPALVANSAIALTRIPLFVIGCWMGRYIKEGRSLSLPVISILTGAAFAMKIAVTLLDVPSALVRYVNGMYALGLIVVLTVLLHLIRGSNVFNSVLRWFGKYSLEIYLTHVTLRNLMKEAGFDAYRISRFAVMLVIAVVLAVGVSRLTGVIERRDRRGNR